MAMQTRNGSAQRKGTNRSRQVNCMFCPTVIDNDSYAMNCESCNRWVCLKCAKISPELYTELNKANGSDGSSALTWFCTACQGMITNFRTINNNILDLKKSNEERLAGVENKIQNLESTVQDTVRKEVETAKDEINESVQRNLAETVSTLVDARLKEMDDRRYRFQNLIFFHVPLSNDQDVMVRKAHDTDLIQKLYGKLFPGEKLSITKCYRIGKWKENAKKSLPLKISSDSREQRRKLLLNSKKIADFDDNVLKEIIVTRDLTDEQREEGRKFRKEKATREKSGDNDRSGHGHVVVGGGADAPSG